MRMACRSCVKEFRCNNFGFGCDLQESKSFYVSQWAENRVAFLAYRLVMALTSVGWTIGFYAFCSTRCTNIFETSYRYLTQWSDLLRTVYFILAAVLAIVGVVNEKKSLIEQSFVPWIRGAMWFTHCIAFSSNAAVTTFFWPFVAPVLDPGIALGVLSVYQHGVNIVLLTADLLIVAFPIRLLHALYSALLAAVYGIFTVILWRTRDTAAVYPVLDWENNPGLATAFIAGSAMIGAPLVQTLAYGIYTLRKYCSSKLRKSRADNVEDLQCDSLTSEKQV